MLPQASQTKHFDPMKFDDIKESFLSFSQTIEELDEQLDKFVNGFLRLGHVTRLSSVIRVVQKELKRTREGFFRNAAALFPELRELALREHKSDGHDSCPERFNIPSRYFRDNLPFDALPTVLEQLAGSISLVYVHVRGYECQEFKFTTQGSRLKPQFSTLEDHLRYRASCAKVYSDRLNTAVIQRYIHQFIYDLEIDIKKLASALNDFTAISLPAIRDEAARASAGLMTGILAAATLFAGVTATTLQMSMGLSDKNSTILVVNTLWFTSLTLSVGAALNCTFVYLFDVIKPLIVDSKSNSDILPPWIRMWMDGSHIFLLGVSILTFSAGLSVFTFSSNQAIYTPYLIIASMGLASAGLCAILIWILYKILMALKVPAAASNNLLREIADCIKKARPWSLFRQTYYLPNNIGKAEEGYRALQDPTSQLDSPDPLPNHDPDEINSPATAPTELDLPDEIIPIHFKSYGTIRDVKYSDDGKRLALTCAKEESLKSYKSWTTVLDAKTLDSIGDKYHGKCKISGSLRWSPSGNRLIVKFERRCDVWDPAKKVLNPIDFQSKVQDVAWFDDDAFLVAFTHPARVIKMDLTGHRMVTYPIGDAPIRSIGIKRGTNYLILITHVTKSPDQFKFAFSGRSEKRIVIYDMAKKETKYQVPVLEDIRSIYPVPDTRDILITHKDQKVFQLWSLDDAESTDMLKPRTITSDRDPGDYIGPPYIGGNCNQFVFNVTTSGDIDIWRRESGMYYRRFQSSSLRGVRCFSWRRSDDETATFATAGSHILLIWRGKLLPSQNSNQQAVISQAPHCAIGEDSDNR